MLRIAERTGDLDGIAIARGVDGEGLRFRGDSYQARLLTAYGRGKDDPRAAYRALGRLKARAVRLGGQATAVECIVRLMRLAADALDVRSGARLARELVEREASSFSYLAYALGQEQIGATTSVRIAFAHALRASIREGDIHRATKATAGLLRTGGVNLVSAKELRWAMSEAMNELDGPPDYRFLAATLGRRTVDR